MAIRNTVSGAAQIAVKQDIGSDAVHAMAQSQTILQTQLWRQAYRRTAVPDEQRRDRNVQPIEQSSAEKIGDCHTAAFHEYAAVAQRAQLLQQILQVQPSLVG